MSEKPANLLVLISGGGRTMANLYETCRRGELNARIARVIASRECPGIKLAASLGLPAEVIDRAIDSDELASIAREHNIELVVLAGYLRKIGIPPKLEGRVLNIHPALLPGDGSPGRFGGKGMHGSAVHLAVLQAGESTSGCTVHLCTDQYDAGEVVYRMTCPVEMSDTVETLAARVFELEKQAYPEAIRIVLERLNAEHPRATT